VNGLPTPRTTLRARYVSLLVWCKGGIRRTRICSASWVWRATRRVPLLLRRTSGRRRATLPGLCRPRQPTRVSGPDVTAAA
jgi:hypothetical protein